MIFFNIIYDFFMIGMLSFGGGYTTIPMVKDIVNKYDVLNMEMLENFIAISESTPGPVAINLATFVGNEVAGVIGGIVATLCEILPAFFIILIFAKYFKKYIDNNNVKYALSIIRPCIIGIIMAVGLGMFLGNIYPYINIVNELNSDIKHNWNLFNVSELVDPDKYIIENIRPIEIKLNYNINYIIKYAVIAILILFIIVLFNKIIHKKLSSLKIIILGAILGIAINYIL